MVKTYSYNPTLNILTAKGGTELDAITFADLFAADQANGWGVVHYCGQNTYHLDCLLYLGDGFTSTYFIDANKLIVFTDQITGPGQYQRIIYLYANSHICLGDLVNEENKDVNNGCVIQLNVESLYNYLFYGSSTNTYRKIYGCTIISSNIYNRRVMICGKDNTRLWHCNFVNYAYPYITGNADIYRLTLTGGSDSIKATAFEIKSGVPTVEDFIATNVRCAVRATLWNWDITVSRMKATNEKAVILDQQKKDLHLVDCDFTNWIHYMQGEDKPGKILRKYSCNIHISDKNGIDLEGVNIVCKDKDYNEVFNVQTDENGNIETQECIYQQWYQLSSGWHDEPSATCFSPHSFEISKENYEPLEIDNITLNEPIKWHLELQDKVEKGMLLVGNNLTGQLQRRSFMSGELQKLDKLTGTLQKKDEMIGILIPKEED